jgi:hypothetical protein
MITCNALGQFMHGQNPAGPPDTRRALKQAFMTIQNAFMSGSRRLRQPTTCLEPRPPDEPSPLESDPTYGQFSARRYRGWFHTDHLIPSAFFSESQPGHEYRDLDFSYIHDPAAEDHVELIAGEPATPYEARREVWVPDNKDMFKDFSFERPERVAAFQWLESRFHVTLPVDTALSLPAYLIQVFHARARSVLLRELTEEGLNDAILNGIRIFRRRLRLFS